jgi:hypothetical protein
MGEKLKKKLKNKIFKEFFLISLFIILVPGLSHYPHDLSSKPENPGIVE